MLFQIFLFFGSIFNLIIHRKRLEILAENMELLSPKVNAQEMGNGVPTESMTGNSDQNMNDSQNVSDDSDNEDSSALPF